MNPNQAQPVSLSSTIASVPIFFKFISICYITSGLLSLVTSILPDMFANQPYYTVFYLNVWRLITSMLVVDSLLSALFGLLLLWFILPQIEKSVSTVMVFVDCLANNCVIQILYCVCFLLVYLVSDNFAKESMMSCGIWGVWMVFLARICESDPDGDIRFCCFPFLIKKKFYPIAIMVLMAIVSFSFPMDMALGYLVGFLQCKVMNGTIVRLSIAQYQKLEDSFLFKCVSHRFDFVRVSQARYAESLSKESQSSYAQFYRNFAQNAPAGGASNQPQSQYNVADNVNPSNFASMKNGVNIGQTQTGQDQTPTNIRKHWQVKSQQSEGPAELQSETSTKAPAGYMVFQDDN